MYVEDGEPEDEETYTIDGKPVSFNEGRKFWNVEDMKVAGYDSEEAYDLNQENIQKNFT